MNTAVDGAFIRRAFDLADLNAVKIALVQATGDPEVAALGPIAELSPDQRELLIAKAISFVQSDAVNLPAELPAEDELRRLMEMATGISMTDEEFEARRGIPGFEEHPWACHWANGKPELPEGFKVAIVGAGFSGIAAGVQMQRLGIPYVIFERQSAVGGVWSANKYPDARVDTLSVTYEFNFEKNYPWTQYFAPQAEVQGYIEHVAKKFGLWENIRFNSDLKAAVFDDHRGVWHLTVGQSDGTTIELDANAVISAVGVFANPLFPNIEGRESFGGPVLHPTQWTSDHNVSGKTVGVIGNGSTGVQLLAPIARDAKQVYVFQRTPQWISPRPKYGQPLEPEMRWLFDAMPGYWNWARYTATSALFASHELMVIDPEWVASGGFINKKNDQIRTDLTAYIKVQVNNREDLVEKLLPDYAPMSRRPVVDNGWYTALTRDNVELVTDGIARLTPNGVETVDGVERQIDILVTATGFDVVKFLWPAEYVGVDGMNLHERWSKDGPRAYLSLMVPGFPNMFMLYGPNSQPVSGGTSLPAWYTIWSGYIGQCIMAMIEGGFTKVQVTEEAHDRYNEALDAEAQTLLLLADEGTAKEKNYYVNDFGRLQVNAPFQSPHFHAISSKPDWNDLELS